MERGDGGRRHGRELVVQVDVVEEEETGEARSAMAHAAEERRLKDCFRAERQQRQLHAARAHRGQLQRQQRTASYSPTRTSLTASKGAATRWLRTPS